MARIEITTTDIGFKMETDGDPLELMGMAEYVKMTIEHMFSEMIKKKASQPAKTDEEES